MAIGEKRISHFTGRRRELALLGNALRTGVRSGMITYSLTGEPGVGRSALLRELRVTARDRGSAVVQLDCTRLRCEHALVCELLEALPAGSASAAALRSETERATAGPGSEPPAAGLPLRGALRRAVEEIVRDAPLVITVDDACRADPQTLDLLSALREACTPLPVLLVISMRQPEHPKVARQLAYLLQDVEPLVLDGLSERDTADLAKAVLSRAVPSGFAAACRRLSAGNPFMLTELLRWVRDQDHEATDPETLGTAVLPEIAASVTRRLDPIDPGLGRLAAMIALTSDMTVDAPLAAHLSGMTLQQTLAAADLLVRMRLIADDSTLTLRHPLLRNALVGGMTRMARNAAHLSAATYLHQRGAEADRVAAHLMASSIPLDDSWSPGIMLQAARMAVRAGDHETALRFAESAVRGTTGEDQRRARLLLADVRLRADTVAGAAACAAMLADTDDERLQQGLLYRTGRALYEATAAEDTEGVMEGTCRAVAGTGYADWPRVHRIATGMFTRSPARVLHMLDELPALDEQPMPPAPSAPHALHSAASALQALCRDLGGDDAGPAVEQARRVLARCTEDSSAHPVTVPAALTVLAQNGRYDEAMTALAAVRRPRVSDPASDTAPVSPLLLLTAGQTVLGQGQLAEAQQYLTEALGGLEGGGAAEPHRASAVGLLADVLATRGRDEQAWTLLRDHRLTGELPPGWHHRHVLLARARLRAVSGDVPGATRDLVELQLRNKTFGVRDTAAVPWRFHGVVLLRQTGSPVAACEAAGEQLRSAEAADTPLDRGRALRALADVSGLLRGEHILREALELLESAGSDLDLAQVHADLGILLIRSGRQHEGVAALAEAVQLARRSGAERLAESVRIWLVAAGERAPQSSPMRGILSLTTRERQILLHATQGHSNRRIAIVLGITPRTVELHLSSAYRKLGITGRRDFREIFSRPGVWALLADGEPGAGRHAPAFAAEPPAGRTDRGLGPLPGLLRLRTEM